jgi:hypothetical protein
MGEKRRGIAHVPAIGGPPGPHPRRVARGGGLLFAPQAAVQYEGKIESIGRQYKSQPALWHSTSNGEKNQPQS